jgi:hypothetical protein
MTADLPNDDLSQMYRCYQWRELFWRLERSPRYIRGDRELFDRWNAVAKRIAGLP